MLSSRLIRAAARIVLVSYVTQLVAPVVYAAEASGESKANWQPLYIPRIEAQEEAHKIIEDYEQGKNDAILSQSEAYQYRLGIKTVDAKKDQFQIKFSRKEKGSTGGFETLYRKFIHQGKVAIDHPLKEADNDVINKN